MRNRFDLKFYLGIAIILAGVILFLDNIGFDFGVNLFDFWPLILIAVGLNHLSQPQEARQSYNGWIFIGFGVLFLLRSFHVIYFHVGELWPLVLILIGLSILKNHMGKDEREQGGTAGDYINLTFLLGGGEHKYTSQTLKSGSVMAFMGGGTIDLRQADCAGDNLVIDVFAIWGGIEIRVPYHWQVNIQGTPILGGMENNTSRNEMAQAADITRVPKQLIVKGSVIMGGLEVKN